MIQELKKWALLFLSVLLVNIFSCKKDDAPQPPPYVPEQSDGSSDDSSEGVKEEGIIYFTDHATNLIVLSSDSYEYKDDKVNVPVNFIVEPEKGGNPVDFTLEVEADKEAAEDLIEKAANEGLIGEGPNAQGKEGVIAENYDLPSSVDGKSGSFNVAFDAHNIAGNADNLIILSIKIKSSTQYAPAEDSSLVHVILFANQIIADQDLTNQGGEGIIYFPRYAKNLIVQDAGNSQYDANSRTVSVAVDYSVITEDGSALKPFTFTVIPNKDTAQWLIDKARNEGLIGSGSGALGKEGVIPENYSIPDQIDGTTGDFQINFDADEILENAGNLLIFSIQMNKSTRYQPAPDSSVLHIVFLVDQLIAAHGITAGSGRDNHQTGPYEGDKTDVTADYLANAGNPFEASEINPDDPRRGILKDWTTNAVVKNQGDMKYGGWDNYGDGGFMSMERYSSPEIVNGKIYQTFTLPSGTYELKAEFLDHAVFDEAYIVVAAGSEMPDYEDRTSSLEYSAFPEGAGDDPISVVFQNPKEQKVTIGIVANFVQDQQYFRLNRWILYKAD